MSHFAKIENNIVTRVIVAEQEFFNTYVDDSPGIWIQTSYNTRGGIHYQPNSNIPSEDQSKALRKNYAGKGYTYDKNRDAFIPPKPFNSWILNEDTCLWDSPTPFPTILTYVKDNKTYYYIIKWSEENLCWVTKTELNNDSPFTLKWNNTNSIWENI
jgi:hypothetical protein